MSLIILTRNGRRMKSNSFTNMLPEDCVSKILSLTSPLDACRSSLVSSTFRSAMESDIVWQKFLPSHGDLQNIISRLVTPLRFSSNKELFLCLCHPVLLDSGKLSFKLQKSCGRKSYVLSARSLSIAWSNNPMYWFWVPSPESRFAEVAVLRTTDWLEIEGKIKTEMLSPNTMYGAYLIIKISNLAYGFDSVAAEVSVEAGDEVSSGGRVYLVLDHHDHDHDQDHKTMLRSTPLIQVDEDRRIPCESENGWMEIELGEFCSGGDHKEVKMSLKEVKGYQLKGGLIVEGIEVRPKQ
ncbi:hypothetical protein Pint_19688 [Pistacia integerrima]|uniref:Uncharacterized protein n=1 Tax=Pistacia integerrima TaxID=434235 RepID=A0ACC0X948_9ROSI|nr:hypothetical protein Pint_19688 [Pistacia integerrima]